MIFAQNFLGRTKFPQNCTDLSAEICGIYGKPYFNKNTVYLLTKCKM